MTSLHLSIRFVKLLAYAIEFLDLEHVVDEQTVLVKKATGSRHYVELLTHTYDR
jgi:hypothetical protein